MKKATLKRRLIVAHLLLSVFIFPVLAQRTRPTTTSTEARRPRLVLLIAVDQFRHDYLERFGDLFGKNGLRRLLRDGAVWDQANYDHTPTYTAPGHATMMTGAYPAETGIVGNEWIERETGRRITSVTDSSVKVLGGGPNDAPASPRRLMASTLGDELRLATNDRSKVIGISVKDRSAILPAGRHANAAYWFSPLSGNMISSTFYFPSLPAWVSDFNQKRPADKFFGKSWERLLPESEYLKRAGVDAPPWEVVGSASGDTNVFPHKITGNLSAPGAQFYSALDFTPFSNDLLVEFAEAALLNEKLGQDDDTDVLTVSFSANDYVGHRYGPYSQEAMDITLRVDRQIETFLDFVDAKVGLRNTIVIFTADHGVAPIPEHATTLGLDGARLNTDEILKTIRAAISARFNPKRTSPDPTADYIYTYNLGGQPQPGFINGNIYLNYAALKRDAVNADEVARVVRDAALTVHGISRGYTRAQLAQGAVSISDPIERRVLHGFYANRSGDVVLIPDPYSYLGEGVLATHGSPYSYDTHVPLIIVASGLIPGHYYDPASPADIAPTVSLLLKTTPPSSAVGRVLTEALRK